MTFWCAMRFEKFPLDTQTCKFQLGSYAMDDRIMVFKMNQLHFNSKETKTILDYTVQVGPLKLEDTLFSWAGAGNYSITGFEMELKRNSLKYLINYYLPSGLFVIVSWTSFLIPPEMVPGRMTLLVTLFLVLINIFNTITISSPNVEGLSSITAWIISCILFVFGALCGYAAILFKKYRLVEVIIKYGNR